MKEIEKADNGEWYCYSDSEIVSRKLHAARACEEFNALAPTDDEIRTAKIKSIIGSCGDGFGIQAPIHFDYGKNIRLGNDFASNYNLTVLGMGKVTIGNHVMIGSNVDIYTVNHPMDPEGRRKHLAKAFPVTIGNDVWIGGHVTITPGITIGNNVVIAAGAVVSKDVPDNSLIAGVPGKVIREL
ncbi:sugar O-acetyltransferase [Apilactobacillus apisilvae]|uniref:Acetyltransferase n=1 Tax=Apilactobacillus apisilvae TaxID=2923364 RepID=A0ABY4PH60_9LACO|nr:sugar O-acetyltransferase [Apilactobacillus apisilvae]UQS84732.1 sugar O-acetyltransferase [Apilactobacillus apisilvae]